MLTVGFEPTRANTVHLKCTPLDQLGHVSVAILGTRQFDLRYQTHAFACCNWNRTSIQGINRLICFAVSSYTILPMGIEPMTFGS